MKCYNFSFNAQGSRIIIVVVQVGIMKIYVVVVEVFKKNEKKGFFHPLLLLLVIFTKVSKFY